MSEGLQKFRELLLTDEAFRQKLKAAIDIYSGDQTQAAIFENVLVPIAAEYGISATYEEFAAYMDGVQKESDSEIDNEELAQLAGGKVVGVGKQFNCTVIGVGIGGGGGDGNGGACFIVGGGWGGYDCSGSGRET